jgi:glycosyltransferase involved in cell wall biosynthesis
VVFVTDGAKTDLVDPTASPARYTWPSRRPTRVQDAVFLHRLISEYRVDALIANGGAVNVTMLVGLLRRVPVRVAWYRTLSEQIAQDTPHPPWKLQLLRWRKQFVYRAATHLVANSEATREDLMQTFEVPEDKTNVFYNTLADPYGPGIENIDPEPDVVLCVGRFNPSKGQDVLIRALVSLSDDVHLRLLGGGPTESSLRRLARDLEVEGRCQFLGTVPYDDVFAHMRADALTVVPSRTEAFGRVNIESLAVGTPVVASRVGGIPEIVRDGVDGLLVPPDDPPALAAALQRLLDDADLRAEMGRNARQRFLSTFERSAVVAQQADWLEHIVSSERPV